MALEIRAGRNKFGIFNFFKVLNYKRKFAKDHPMYFYADGLVVFTGPQGSGKTLSAVLYIKNLMEMYPEAIIVSNIELNFALFDNKKVFPFQNASDLSRYNNGEKGVIFLIDEIQLYFNSLESKNINPEVMTQILQQRKQRKHIVCTSQVFGRMAKPLREQFSNVIVCKCYLGCFQVNKLVDRDSIEEFDNGTSLKGTVKKKFMFFHDPKYYNYYNTYYVIDKNKFIYNEEKKGDIYNGESRLYINNINGK